MRCCPRCERSMGQRQPRRRFRFWRSGCLRSRTTLTAQQKGRSVSESNGKTRHVLGLSGGKDSAALAIYMRDREPQMEYFFCDTGRELPETYEFLQRLEVILGKPIERLNSDRDFDHWLHVFGGALPSPQMRWC